MNEDRVRSKPRLLFLCQNLPFPPDGGGLIRSFHTLRLLSEQYRVTALCFFRTPSRAITEDQVREGLAPYTSRLDIFPIPQDHSRFRLFLDHARSIGTGRAYTRWTYESRQFRHVLTDLISGNDYSIVHLDSLDLVGYLPAVRHQRVVVAHHNVESELLARRARSLTFFRRTYLRFQSALTRREERRWCPRVDLNVTVSDQDAATLLRNAPSSTVTVAPNGVDTKHFQPSQSNPKRELIFVGGYTWFPNRHGMQYFAERILPLIRKSDPDVPITWVGRARPEVMSAMESQGVRMTGYVPDIRPFVAQAACFIVPILVGGGTRLKIVDAWAMGKAVVSTRIGCEGLRTEHGDNILIASSDQEFADASLSVLNDDSLRRRLETQGRETAVTYYDWSVIGNHMLDTYSQVSAQ